VFFPHLISQAESVLVIQNVQPENPIGHDRVFQARLHHFDVRDPAVGHRDEEFVGLRRPVDGAGYLRVFTIWNVFVIHDALFRALQTLKACCRFGFIGWTVGFADVDHRRIVSAFLRPQIRRKWHTAAHFPGRERTIGSLADNHRCRTLRRAPRAGVGSAVSRNSQATDTPRARAIKGIS
jgi:hypothetical protein